MIGVLNTACAISGLYVIFGIFPSGVIPFTSKVWITSSSIFLSNAKVPASRSALTLFNFSILAAIVFSLGETGAKIWDTVHLPFFSSFSFTKITWLPNSVCTTLGVIVFDGVPLTAV